MNNCGKLDGKMRTCVVWVNPTVENMGFLLGDHIFSSKGGRMYTCEEAVVWKYSSGMDKVPTLTFLQLKSEINCILQADPKGWKNENMCSLSEPNSWEYGFSPWRSHI